MQVTNLKLSSKPEAVLPGSASQDNSDQIRFYDENKDFLSHTVDLYLLYTTESDNPLSIPANLGGELPFPGQQFSTFL